MTQNKLHRIIPFLLLAVALMLSVESGAQRARNRRRGINDTVRVDSLGADTLAVDSVGAKKKEPLDAPVVYEANDSIVFMDGLVHLYGQSKVNYEKIELTSEIITMNMDSSTVFARGIVDSKEWKLVCRSLRIAIRLMNRRKCAITSRARKVSSTRLLLNKGKGM